MKNLTIKQIVAITKGNLIIGNEENECENFCKDTRIIQANDTYIGLNGENFDGNQFWKEAFQKGASTAILQKETVISKEDVEKYSDKNIIVVENTLKAMQEIASYKRSFYHIPIVAVTGSVGKTSTKDMIYSVLSQKYKTLKTVGNNNNHIGLPLTLLRLKQEEAAVIEMGMNHFGEISLLTNLTKPTLSVITNIGTSHIGNLGSRENILKAKLEILEGMEDKKIILNEDNDLLLKWEKDKKENCGLNKEDKIKIHSYGIEKQADVMAKEIQLKENGSSFKAKIGDKEFIVEVPVAGIHFVYNALCSICVGLELGLTIEEIQKGIATFQLTEKRMDIINLKNGAKIINDAYNASFESMQASLKVLGEYKKNRKIAVLGDMFELGEHTKQLHEEVGKEVAKNHIDLLFCHGDYAIDIVKQAERAGMNREQIYFFETKDSLLEAMNEMIKPEDVILLKASNGMKFYELAQKLKEERG